MGYGPWGPRESHRAERLHFMWALDKLKKTSCASLLAAVKMGARRAFYFILLLSGVPVFRNHWI